MFNLVIIINGKEMTVQCGKTDSDVYAKLKEINDESSEAGKVLIKSIFKYENGKRIPYAMRYDGVLVKK